MSYNLTLFTANYSLLTIMNIGINTNQTKFFTLLALCLLTVSLAHCRPEPQSNLKVDTWQGRVISDGPQVNQNIKFSELKTPRLILNVYSPTCVPCIQEIPALEVLYKKTLEKKGRLYMIVEGRPEAFDLKVPEGATQEQKFQIVVERIRADIKKYKIKIPVVVMGPEFEVSYERGPVTATPETLFFKTGPLTLEYNFIGAVSTIQKEEDLKLDSRFQFILGKI